MKIEMTHLKGILTLCMLIQILIASATNYYVSADGNDADNGSIDTPWKSLAKVSAVGHTDANGGIIMPGDSIFFRSGDIFLGNLIFRRSGKVEDPIVISSYGTGELPIISGSGDIAGGDYFEAIKLLNCSYVEISKLWIQNDRRNGQRYTYGKSNSFGIQIVSNEWGPGVIHDLVFRDLKLSNIYGIEMPDEFNQLSVTGIRISSEANAANKIIAINDVLVEDCYFTHIGKAGVWSVHKGNLDPNDDLVNRNQNIIVRNNTFYQTGGSGVILSKTFNGLIENNDFVQTGYSDGIEDRLAGRGSGAWVWSCRNIIAQYNRSYGVRGPNDSYGMHIDFGNKDIIFQYNYSEESEGGFCEILGNNVNSTYRFNVSVNDGLRDFHGNTLWVSDFAGTNNRISSDHNFIYNNTIYLDKDYAPDITIKAKNTYVYNNIFKVSKGQIGEKTEIDIDAGSSLKISNNLFEGNINSSFTSLDPFSQSGDPLFENDDNSVKDPFQIQNGSPAIDKGKIFSEPSFPMAGIGIFKNISEYPETDTFGNPVNISQVPVNIGASNDHNSGNTLGLFYPTTSDEIFNLYPNPVVDQINLSFKKDIQISTIEIFNVQGESIYKSSLESSNQVFKVQLPESINNGIYFLRIISGTLVQTSQFVLYR